MSCLIMLELARLAKQGEPPDEVANGLFDVNFWGAINISRVALRLFRETDPPSVGGTLPQTPSFHGVQSATGLAYYAAREDNTCDLYLLPQLVSYPNLWLVLFSRTYFVHRVICISLEGFSETLAKELDPK